MIRFEKQLFYYKYYPLPISLYVKHYIFNALCFKCILSFNTHNNLIGSYYYSICYDLFSSHYRRSSSNWYNIKDGYCPCSLQPHYNVLTAESQSEIQPSLGIPWEYQGTKVWLVPQLCPSGVSIIAFFPSGSASGWLMEKAQSEFAAYPSFSSQFPI